MRSGFTLIEFVLSVLIGSLLSVALLTALYQVGRFQTTLDDLVAMYMRVGVAVHQIEKDLMGAFIPAKAQLKEKKEEIKNEKNIVEEKSEKKDEIKELEKIFYSQEKGEKFELLTFITNNPMSVYVSEDVGKVKPKVARIVYVLAQDPEKKDSFVLFRQEGQELDFSLYKDDKKIRRYELVNDIKDFSISFIARIEKKEEKKEIKSSSIKEKSAITYEYKKVKIWTSEAKQKDQKTEEMPRIPHFVEITLTLWNRQHTKEESFVLSFTIPTDTKLIKEEKPKREEKKKEEPGSKNQQKLTLNKKKKKEKQKQTLDSLSLSLERIVNIFVPSAG